MCGCKNNQSTNNPQMPQSVLGTSAVESNMNDQDYVMCVYTHPNRGQHRVFGAPPERRNYGYRAGGDQFLVHRDDVRSYPQYFQPVAKAEIRTPVPAVARKAPPPPESVVDAPPPPVVDEPEETLASADEVAPPAVKAAIDKLDLQTLPGVTPAVERAMEQAGLNTPADILESGPRGLKKVKGIGEARARMIYEHISDRWGDEVD